jgi:hypothetical protein
MIGQTSGLGPTASIDRFDLATEVMMPVSDEFAVANQLLYARFGTCDLTCNRLLGGGERLSRHDQYTTTVQLPRKSSQAVTKERPIVTFGPSNSVKADQVWQHHEMRL